MTDSRLHHTRVVAVAFIIAAALAYLLTVVIAPGATLLSLLSDDAFYYFKIAKHITAGQGSTFDDIAPTNGYHPLWMIFMICIFFAGGSGLLAPVIAVMILCGILATATLLLLRALVDEHIAPGFGLVAVAVAFLPNVMMGMLNGMETAAQLFALTLFLFLSYRRRLLVPGNDQTPAFWLGVLLGIVTLARLDSVFVFVAALVMSVVATAASGLSIAVVVRRVAMMIGGYALMMGPYFLWNFTEFGHTVPISGTVKSAFPQLASPLTLAGDKGIGAMMIAAVLILVVPALLAGKNGRKAFLTLSTSPLAVLALACVFHFANVFLFMSWGVYWWHFTMYGLTIAAGLALTTYRIAHNRQWMTMGLIVGLCVPLLAGGAALHVRAAGLKKELHSAWRDAAIWARDNTAANAVLAIADAGIFGYYSERRVINLDGKANGYDYLEKVNADDVEGYLRSVDTNYLANIRVRYRSGIFRLSVPRVNRPSARISVHEDWEVYRSPLIVSDAPRFGTPTRSHFVIWEFPSLAIDHIPPAPQNRAGKKGSLRTTPTVAE